MSEIITKEDLIQFGLHLRNDIYNVLTSKSRETDLFSPKWLKSRAVRKMMDMSAGSIQNLRVTGKVRYKKVLGSYYYNKKDLEKLFKNAKENQE
ncbi:hypothetical protein [Flavobacterium sp. TAB 87]|uniref:hypothetical protein n=1 Tax=Flavobacterium sp. TAB 87 TaxID=1729581 RepID=UPI00076D503A|nr:hypothetical protein [Flavobacterium sp. TAB 87]KVV14601.1 hypothetical protein AP058_01653 [Flavobacterium sp. TAB 87]